MAEKQKKVKRYKSYQIPWQYYELLEQRACQKRIKTGENATWTSELLRILKDNL